MRIALVAMLLLLAGCTQSPAVGPAENGDETVNDASAPGQPGSVPAAANTSSPNPGIDIKSYAHSFDLLVNPDTEVIGIGGTTENCVFFWDTDGTDVRILGGAARLSWDATPNTSKFRIIAATTEEEAASAYGSSPVEWTFGRLSPAAPPKGPNWGVGWGADYTVFDATAPVAQAMVLELEFTYTGTLPEPGLGGCGGGHL